MPTRPSPASGAPITVDQQAQGERMTIRTNATTDADAALFGNRFVTQQAPSRQFPDTGMTSVDAFRLVSEEMALEGDPARNLATFVTTWMEPEAQRLIAANLHRNFID